MSYKVLIMRAMLYFTSSCGVVLILFAIGWLVWHYNGLKPELLFERPIESCGTIQFSTNGWVWVTLGEEVDTICRSEGFQSELRFEKYNSFFAVKGNKATRFVPYVFHGVHGDILFESANPNMVYFYRYKSRYHPIVLQP